MTRIGTKKLLALIALTTSIASVHGQQSHSPWPIHDNGLNEDVQWDHHSYYVNGERLFVFSGEFHYWRIPVPELWRDLLEKVKAAGFNAFSIYNSWAYHSASPDKLDFETGAHDFSSIMTLAKELGLYLIIRPGPYVNAETNAGGFPLWLTTGAYGKLRNDDDRYTAAWKPYWEKISQVVEPHLVTNGGNVFMYQIENEYEGQWKDEKNKVVNPDTANYMQLLQDVARDNGINVPLAHNAPNMRGHSWSKDFSNATGNVDVVGVDSYPSCWSCNLSECTGTNGKYVPYQTQNYVDYFSVQSPSQPNFMPEFQGGSYNPWGGPEGGCPGDIGADFANMFYRNLIYQRVTAISLYMLYGGTNWGWLSCPVVASSYDYSSPVSENRAIGSKYYETKLLTLFTRVAKDLTYTNRLGNSTDYTTNEAITASELRNPETNAGFYVVMHDDSPSGTKETFKLHVDTSEGELTIPQYAKAITINGHQAKILVTDFTFGSKELLYSTAEVLSYAVIDGKEVLALWLPQGEEGEFRLKDVKSVKAAGNSTISVHPGDDGVTVSYVQQPGMSVLHLDDGARILLLDRQAAYHFWVPTLDNDPMAPANNTVFVQGAYLIRSASYDADEQSLQINGDESEASSLVVFAPKSIKTISWNGKQASIKSRNEGMFVISADGPETIKLPPLEGWKYTNGLPEIAENYSPDSLAWIVANKTETPNPKKPDGGNPVLYVDDYKVHYGNHIYRATFKSTDEPPTGVSLDLIGGLAFGWSVWLNSEYIGSYYGLSNKGTGSEEFSFKNATLKDAGDNVLVVVMDNSGHDLRAGALDPRGITKAKLLGPGSYKFTEWKIAGNAGLEDNLDPVRGPLNEGSLYAERVGMHLPGYPDERLEDLPSSNKTLIVPGAGIRVFRTVIPLNIPKGVDASISFHLTTASGSTFTASSAQYTNRLRALLFVNGYQYGRFTPYIGNQVEFPVPPGILDYAGNNTIMVTAWSQSAEGVELKMDWKLDYVHTSSFDMKFESAELRPGWTDDRLQYA